MFCIFKCFKSRNRWLPAYLALFQEYSCGKENIPINVSTITPSICCMMTSSHGNITTLLALCDVNDKGPGPCITNVIATCRKNFSQWESSFLWKLRYHWLKFLRRVAKTLVIQGPGLLWCFHCCSPQQIVQRTIGLSVIFDTIGPVYQHGLTLIPAWINNNIHQMYGMKLLTRIRQLRRPTLYWACDYLVKGVPWMWHHWAGEWGDKWKPK